MRLKKFLGHTPMVYEWTGAALALSAGSSVYGSVQQKKAVEEQEDIQRQAAEDAKAQELAMFEQQAVDAGNQGNATVEFGVDDEDDEFGTYNDFLSPVQSTTGLGGAKGNIGLMV